LSSLWNLTPEEPEKANRSQGRGAKPWDSPPGEFARLPKVLRAERPVARPDGAEVFFCPADDRWEVLGHGAPRPCDPVGPRFFPNPPSSFGPKAFYGVGSSKRSVPDLLPGCRQPGVRLCFGPGVGLGVQPFRSAPLECLDAEICGGWEGLPSFFSCLSCPQEINHETRTLANPRRKRSTNPSA